MWIIVSLLVAAVLALLCALAFSVAHHALERWIDGKGMDW